MVDVTFAPSEAESDRGQMLLIAAFGLAVMLVAMALILNTAIYTQNIATRGSDIVGGKDAAQYRESTLDMGATVVTTVNYRNNSSDYANLHAELVGSVVNWNNGTARMKARFATVSNVSVLRTSNGTRIYQLDGGNFTNETAPNGDFKVDWHLFNASGDVDHVRNFTMTVENASLAQLDTSLGLISEVAVSDTFYFELTGSGGAVRQVHIYTQQDGDFVVEIQDGGGTLGTCVRSVSDGEANVSVTNASVEGQRCEYLSFFDDLDGPYELTFNNTKTSDTGEDTIEGNYTLVVNATRTELSTANNFAGFDDPGHPGITPAIYSATLRFTYRSPRLLYSTQVRVAPGEQDD